MLFRSILYDADRVEEAASTPDESKLYEAQLGLFLDPNDPEVVKQALKDGISEEMIEAAQKYSLHVTRLVSSMAGFSSTRQISSP